MSFVWDVDSHGFTFWTDNTSNGKLEELFSFGNAQKKPPAGKRKNAISERKPFKGTNRNAIVGDLLSFLYRCPYEPLRLIAFVLPFIVIDNLSDRHHHGFSPS